MIETAGETPSWPVHKVRSVRAVGTRAVLAELSGTQDVLALQALLLADPLPGQLDVLAAAETVLVTADSPASAAADRRAGCSSSTSPHPCSGTASWWSLTPCTTAKTSPRSGS